MHTCRRPSAAPGSYCRAAVPHREPLRQARTLLSCRRDPRHRFAAQGRRCQVICSASTARGAQAFCPCAICSWSTPPLSAAQRRAEHSVPGPPWSTRPLLSLPPRYHPATARGRRGCVERMMRSAEMAVVGAASKAGHHSAAQVDAMPKQAQPPGQRHGLAVYVDPTSMVIVTSSPAAMASPVSTSAVWICRDQRFDGVGWRYGARSLLGWETRPCGPDISCHSRRDFVLVHSLFRPVFQALPRLACAGPPFIPWGIEDVPPKIKIQVDLMVPKMGLNIKTGLVRNYWVGFWGST